MTTHLSQHFNRQNENQPLRKRDGVPARTKGALVQHSQVQSAQQEVEELRQEALREEDVLRGQAAQHQARRHVVQRPHRTLEQRKKVPSN